MKVREWENIGSIHGPPQGMRNRGISSEAKGGAWRRGEGSVNVVFSFALDRSMFVSCCKNSAFVHGIRSWGIEKRFVLLGGLERVVMLDFGGDLAFALE